MFDPQLVKLFGDGILETLYMTLVSTTISYLLGLPIGVLLTTSAPDGISPRPVLYRTLDVVVNILRSVPFLILMVCVLGLTRFLVGTIIGSTAVIPPLVIAAAPYVGRMVEGSLKEVDHGVIEAAQSMGASVFQIITRVLLPESTPSLLNGAAIVTTTILSYSAMAGALGGGGLGAIAINYGYHRFQPDMMWIAVVLLVLLVSLGLGYLTMSLIGGVAGACCSGMEEAGEATGPVMLLTMAGYLASCVVGAVSSGPVAVFSTLCPIVSIFCAPVQFAGGNVSIWLVLASWAIQAVVIWGLLTLASRVYAGLIVHRGSRVKLCELMSMAKGGAVR